MIIKLDHIALASLNLEKDGEKLQKSGYGKVFENSDLPNPKSKAAFMETFSERHSSALYEKAGAPPIELLDHGHDTGREGYLWLHPDRIVVRTGSVAKSSIFWMALGFSENQDRTLRFKALLPGTKEIVLRLEETAGVPMLDDKGYNCLAFVCTDIEKDAAKLRKTGAQVQPTEGFVSNGRPLQLAFARGPGGELVELIQVKKV